MHIDFIHVLCLLYRTLAEISAYITIFRDFGFTSRILIGLFVEGLFIWIINEGLLNFIVRF